MLSSTIFLHPLTLWNVNDTAQLFKRWLHPSYHISFHDIPTDSVPALTLIHTNIRKAIPKNERKASNELLQPHNDFHSNSELLLAHPLHAARFCVHPVDLCCKSNHFNKNCFLSQKWLHSYLSPAFNYCQLSFNKFQTFRWNSWWLHWHNDFRVYFWYSSTIQTSGTDKKSGFWIL